MWMYRVEVKEAYFSKCTRTSFRVMLEVVAVTDALVFSLFFPEKGEGKGKKAFTVQNS